MGITLSLRLPEHVVAGLEQISSATERSKSFHVQKALESYLGEHVELQIARDRSQNSSDPVVSIDDLRKNLGE